jgi:Glycosyltransferase family 87
MGVAIFLSGLVGWGTESVLMRGNIEGIVWIFVCLGAALYASRRYNGAAMAFGVSCCLKPYPVLWFALMARQRRYREILVGLVTIAVVTLASFQYFDRNPIRAYHRINPKSEFFQLYVVSIRPIEEMFGDHSLLQSMKTVARVVRNHGLDFPGSENLLHANDPLAWKLYQACVPITIVISLIVLWKTWNKPVLNQIFVLATVTMVLPLLAGDYTLTLVLIPMAFFLIFLLEDVVSGKAPLSLRQILWFLLPCAFLTGTEPLWVFHGVLKCIALLVLLAVSATIPLPSTLFGELSSSDKDTPMRSVASA